MFPVPTARNVLILMDNFAVAIHFQITLLWYYSLLNFVSVLCSKKKSSQSHVSHKYKVFKAFERCENCLCTNKWFTARSIQSHTVCETKQNEKKKKIIIVLQGALNVRYYDRPLFIMTLWHRRNDVGGRFKQQACRQVIIITHQPSRAVFIIMSLYTYFYIS